MASTAAFPIASRACFGVSRKRGFFKRPCLPGGLLQTPANWAWGIAVPVSSAQTVSIDTIFSGFSPYVMCFHLASPGPVYVAHVSNVGVVAPCMTRFVFRKYSTTITRGLKHASSYTYLLAVLRRLRLKSFRGARGIPETPFLHAIAACQRGQKIMRMGRRASADMAPRGPGRGVHRPFMCEGSDRRVRPKKHAHMKALAQGNRSCH